MSTPIARPPQEAVTDGGSRGFRILGGLIIGGLAATVLYSLAATPSAIGGTLASGALVAGASLLLGGLLGFLFGIPRALQREQAPQKPTEPERPPENNGATDARPAQPPAVGYLPNTNLEEISDWLTKILVGVGLTQLGEVPERFEATAVRVAAGFGASAAAVTFAGAAMLYFLICGFLFAFLWTRIHLPGVLRQADLSAIAADVHEAKQRADAATAAANTAIGAARQAKSTAAEAKGAAEEAERGAESAHAMADKAAVNAASARARALDALEAAVGPGLEKRALEVEAEGAPPSGFAVAPGPDTEDPWKGQFGGSQVRNHRELVADVRPLSTARGLFSIELVVRSQDPVGHPLTEPVEFYLHPTFSNSKPIVHPGPDGIAELRVTAWGAFTVGVLADRGATRLELDLAELKGAPEEFRSR
jgi:hypothetical protein